MFFNKSLRVTLSGSSADDDAFRTNLLQLVQPPLAARESDVIPIVEKPSAGCRYMPSKAVAPVAHISLTKETREGVSCVLQDSEFDLERGWFSYDINASFEGRTAQHSAEKRATTQGRCSCEVSKPT